MEIVQILQKVIPTMSSTTARKRKRSSSNPSPTSNLFCGFMGHDVFITDNQLGQSVKNVIVGEIVRI